MENLTFKKKAKQTFGEFMNINNIAALLFFLNCSPLKFNNLRFKILHGVAPSYLKDLVSVLPVSRYQLRRNNNGILLERPQLRTKKTLGDRALSMAAPFLWNSLPLPIRQETSIDSFKRSVKTYLFKKAFS